MSSNNAVCCLLRLCWERIRTHYDLDSWRFEAACDLERSDLIFLVCCSQTKEHAQLLTTVACYQTFWNVWREPGKRAPASRLHVTPRSSSLNERMDGGVLSIAADSILKAAAPFTRRLSMQVCWLKTLSRVSASDSCRTLASCLPV